MWDEVEKQCSVPISMEKTYRVEVLCEVVEMESIHILLGCPLQYDVRVLQDGYANTYTFMREGIKMKVIPSCQAKLKAKEGKKLFISIIVPEEDSFSTLIVKIKEAKDCLGLGCEGRGAVVHVVPQKI